MLGWHTIFEAWPHPHFDATTAVLDVTGDGRGPAPERPTGDEHHDEGDLRTEAVAEGPGTDGEAAEPLEVLALLDEGGAELPAYMRTLADLPAGDDLGAFGLLGAGEGGPEGRRSLATSSPAELLGRLGLCG